MKGCKDMEIRKDIKKQCEDRKNQCGDEKGQSKEYKGYQEKRSEERRVGKEC